jgi:ATP-dependent protease Clp ATPase subunit
MKWSKRSSDADSMRCSFCHKTQDTVGKLISSPSDYAHAYICDECIAICTSIVEDDKSDTEQSEDPTEAGSPHPLFAHPLASELMDAIERWIHEESLGNDGANAVAAVRTIASRMVRGSG